MKKTINTMKTSRYKYATGKGYKLTQLRNQDFINACSSVLERYRRLGRPVSASVVVDEVLRSGAPGYYVSLDHCVETVGRLLSGRVLKKPVYRAARKRMWAEITRRVKERLNKEEGKTLTQCVSDVLTHNRASTFFMSHDYALRIFRSHFKTVSSYEAV